MSDTHLFLIIGAGALVVLAEHAALLAVGYLASRRALHEAVGQVREMRLQLVAAEAIIADCEERGYIQADHSGRHRAEAPDA